MEQSANMQALTSQTLEQEGVRAPVRIRGTAGAESEGEVFIRTWTLAERRRRSLIILAKCWGAAAIAVVVPMLHFVLVPVLVIVGPIWGWFLKRQERIILGGSGTCPKCSEPFKIERALDRWPLSDICDRCHAHVTIEQLSS